MSTVEMSRHRKSIVKVPRERLLEELEFLGLNPNRLQRTDTGRLRQIWHELEPQRRANAGDLHAFRVEREAIRRKQAERAEKARSRQRQAEEIAEAERAKEAAWAAGWKAPAPIVARVDDSRRRDILSRQAQGLTEEVDRLRARYGKRAKERSVFLSRRRDHLVALLAAK